MTAPGTYPPSHAVNSDLVTRPSPYGTVEAYETARRAAAWLDTLIHNPNYFELGVPGGKEGAISAFEALKIALEKR